MKWWRNPLMGFNKPLPSDLLQSCTACQLAGSVHEIDGGCTIRHQVPLQPQSLQKFRLHLWPRSGHGCNRRAANALHTALEFVGLNLRQLSCLLQLQFVHFLLKPQLSLLLDILGPQLRLHCDTLGFGPQLRNVHLRLTLDLSSSRHSLRFGLAGSCGLNGSRLCLQSEQHHLLFLRLGFVIDDLPLQLSLGNLFSALSIMSSCGFLGLRGDFNGELY
mmetsp:Transcript_58605/g.96186  ORF Transcript_58605/g.96186 Transcript_58605/m.96186 type:complete len:218 (-) Transcript_58605:1540-2193(-)